MTAPPPPPPAAAEPVASRRARRIHLLVAAVLLGTLVLELALLLLRERWMHAALVTGVIAVIVAPLVFRRRLPIEIPSEIQLFVILFLFATLFLGEVRDYYERFWWWDLALHGTAGLLLGMLGFMIVYMLNENEHVDLHMRPSFVALFAFCFAVTIGAVWEIFEFAMDQTFGLNMQKPMLGDPSGLTDTMWDLIVDTIGAAIVSLAGWRYLRWMKKPASDSRFKRFLLRNPQLFGR
jgi:uncharacterized membrane protein YjdF